MKITRVTYKVKPEYVETNKRNVERVMADVRALNNPGIRYATWLLADGVTFMHLGQFADEAAAKVLGTVESFNHFRKQLVAEGAETMPDAVPCTLVGSSYDIF